MPKARAPREPKPEAQAERAAVRPRKQPTYEPEPDHDYPAPQPVRAGPPVPPRRARLQREWLHLEIQRYRRQLEEAGEAPPDLGERIRQRQGKGSPLPAALQAHLERHLGAPLPKIVIHADEEADALAGALGAEAFTAGQDVFFRQGAYDPESEAGQRLIAHEAAHVLQQARGPVDGTPIEGGVKLSSPSDPYEQEAESRARTLPKLDWRAATPQPPEPWSRARERWQDTTQRLIREYRARQDGPAIASELRRLHPDDRSAVERALQTFLSRGEWRSLQKALEAPTPAASPAASVPSDKDPKTAPVEPLEPRAATPRIEPRAATPRIEPRAATPRIEPRVATPRIEPPNATPRPEPTVVQRFANREVAVQHNWLTDGLKKVGNAVGNAAGAGFDLIKDKVADLAANLPGYKELTQALGRDPISGKNVQVQPGAFLNKLLGLPVVPPFARNVLEGLQKAGEAVSRGWNWFKGELGKLNLGPAFKNIVDGLRSLGPSDLLSPVKAFNEKVKAPVMAPINRFLGLAKNSVLKLGEFVLDALAKNPTAKRVVEGVKGAGGVLLGILKNPGAFARNMIKAGKGGFEGFSKNARTHLTTGLGEWLTGASGGIGFPRRLDDAMALLPVALGIMGFSYRNVRAKLVKQIGPQGEHIVSRAETATDGSLSAFQALKNSGLHKAKDMGEAANLIKTEAIGGIKNYVIAEVIKKAVIKVASLLIPGGGFVQAILSVFDTAMFFVERAKQIASLGSSILNSVSAIAAGNLTAATQRVELSLAKAIPVTLSFLSRFLGLGKIGNKLREIVNKVKGKVENVLDKIVARFTPVIKKWAQEPGIGKHDDPKAAQGGDHRTRAQKEADVGKAVAEADKLLLADEATEQGIRGGLPAIKQRYKLSSISLVKEPDGAYHVTAVINPTARTPSRKLHTDFYPVSMDAEPNDKGILVKYTTRAGKSFQVQVGRSGHVTQAQGFSLDLTSLGRGVTQDPANKQKNAGQNSAHIIANWFGGSGYKKSLNLIATSDYFNKVVMGRVEDNIARWVKTTSITAFDLSVTVDWGTVSEESVITGIMQNLQTASGLSPDKATKVKQRSLALLARFKPLLKAVEDVTYKADGTTANGQQKIYGPVSTGRDKWLKTV